MTPSLNDLRQSAHRVLNLPAQAQQVMDAYLHLRIDGAEVACPYHINPGIRSTNRALLGKGSPAEIQAIATNYFTRYDMHTGGDPETLRAFLSACGIGIDCSGFASWILNGLTQATLGRPIWKCLTFPGGARRQIISKLRPVENISADLLTGHLNSRPVPDLSLVKPGDLIRAASWHHVVIITEVGLDTSGHANYFQYAQSSCMYGADSGVRTGHAVITNPQQSLLAQTWVDNYKSSVIKALIKEGGDDSRLVRLKVF